MLIIVTDEGEFWNHRNPLLERYADSVLVVCLGGKKVTDQYRCFVPPHPGFRGRGMPDNCAGTCPQCDVELRELQQLLQAIPESERVYPQFEIRDVPAMPVYNDEMTGLLRRKEPPESDATKGATDHE